MTLSVDGKSRKWVHKQVHVPQSYVVNPYSISLGDLLCKTLQVYQLAWEASVLARAQPMRGAMGLLPVSHPIVSV